jgi:hypothetical protein
VATARPGGHADVLPGELVTQDDSDDEGNGEEDAAEDQRAETGAGEGGAGGAVQREQRMRASLAPGTAADAARPRDNRVEEDQDQWMLLRALDADAERIVEDVDAGNAQDVASALTSGTQTDGGQRGRDDDAMQRRCAEWEGRWPQQRVAPTMREIRGGIRNGDAVQGVLGEERLHRVWERQTEALADARAHAWDPKDYTPATDPLGLVERGVDMPAAHEYGGFWRVGACDAYGWGDATDARINADPVQRLWQRCSAMEIDGRGLKDKNGTWVTSDAGGRKNWRSTGRGHHGGCGGSRCACT